MARPPETSAGSERTARMEMEASGTWEIHRGLRSQGRSMLSTRHIQRQAEAAMEVGLADSTLSTGKPCTWGSGEQGEFLFLGTHGLHTEGESP